MLALAVALLVAVLGPLTAASASDQDGPVSRPADQSGAQDGAARAARPAPRREVWQAAEPAYPENRRNPLAGRVWGVYQGPQDQVWAPFQATTGTERRLVGKIALRPRTKWYGTHVPDDQIESRARDYIAASQQGDPERLVQIAVFRMQPWEHEACTRPSTPAERQSYRTWIDNLARGIGATPTLVVMQPDGPFLWCVPDRGKKSRLLSEATRTLSALPNTEVYLDAGAADWCENDRGNDPRRCAQILKRTGIEHARGFALDSTHYTGPGDNIRHGHEIVKLLKRWGYGKKHFIIDTAKSGRPTRWLDMVPATKHDLTDNARTCTSRRMKRCVTLGIPPTVRVAARRWGLPAQDRRVAARYVDGFVWFGRPWLYNQADPFVLQRALDMGRSTPWPGPLL
ncbi:glycoside hydrolase family 6 protein [Nocardioides campestrisoli]|uniref:glycoside hydrolase family 6 protein n=1 Tax=Nocardioides campestrisoli TaxID=2736757 RepID=UPI00163D58AD|nr:glycoside hydrolase family 6 protein [Nocardioides campestrisoli]